MNFVEIIWEVLGTELNVIIILFWELLFFGEYCMENYLDIVFFLIDKEWMKRRKLVYKLLYFYGEGI